MGLRRLWNRPEPQSRSERFTAIRTPLCTAICRRHEALYWPLRPMPEKRDADAELPLMKGRAAPGLKNRKGQAALPRAACLLRRVDAAFRRYWILTLSAPASVPFRIQRPRM